MKVYTFYTKSHKFFLDDWFLPSIKKYNKLSLAVYKDNKRAVEFYNNRGFKVVKEQANEDSGFKEYIMQFEI